MNAYYFLMAVPDEQVTRARIALKLVMSGNWLEASNQYAHLSVELADTSLGADAESLHQLCISNYKMFQVK